LTQAAPVPKSRPGGLPPLLPQTAQALPAVVAPPAAKTLTADIALSDIGFNAGIRFANLGGRREIFVPLPQDEALSATALTLSFDDVSAYEAKRSLEVIVNDRTVAALALNGSGTGRSLRIPLGNIGARDGFLKLAFVYAGAASQDRCIDVRYVGDSLTIRPETAIAVEFDPLALREVTTIAVLFPRNVSVLLSNRKASPTEIAAGLTVARALAFSGRKAHFRATPIEAAARVDQDGRRHWQNGTIIVGPVSEAGTVGSGATAAGSVTGPGIISAVRVDGEPGLLLGDAAGSLRAARLLGTPAMHAARGLSEVSAGEATAPARAGDRVTFEALGFVPAVAEVFGRADLAAAIDTRLLPPDTRMARLALDLMVAPDSVGEKAVISVFVNDRLLASTVAASGAPTHMDVTLPDGLVGTVANIRAMVQRRSAGGECRFEPQGYPAQILGSSAVILAPAGTARDFSDLATQWTNGVEVMLPSSAASRRDTTLALVAQMLGALSPPAAPITVKFSDATTAPSGPFIAVSASPPPSATPRVRFDRGRVAGADRNGHTLLDLGGFRDGAVAQLITVSGHPGIWIKPLADNGALPAPAKLTLDRGDVAFIDRAGVALAMATERDTLVHIKYPDQISWLNVAERFRAWIVGALWLLATIAFLFVLQQMLRRRRQAAGE
jgi:hypothetical protein